MRIFVSYARQDSGAIESIKQAIEGMGQELWFDRELKGGQQWWDVILEQIRSCDVFMFALSPHSAKSKACRLELEYAIDTNRPLLPIMVRTVDARLFPERLANYQYVDYREVSIPTTIAVVSALNRLPAAGPPPDPLPAPPPVPITYLDEFTKKLDAESLGLREQRAMVSDLEPYLADEDDRSAAISLLQDLRRRPDIMESVGREIDRLLAGAAAPSPEFEPVVEASTEASNGDSPAVEATPSPEPRSSGSPLKVHRFVAPNVDTGKLAARLENWLTSERLETQRLDQPGAVMVQARSAESWKRWVGAGVAFTVVLRTEGPDLIVEIGQAEWKDKAAAAAVGLLIAWPALIPAAFGMAKQKQLPDQALRLIEQSIADATPARD
jgi:hypothetical protein